MIRTCFSCRFCGVFSDHRSDIVFSRAGHGAKSVGFTTRKGGYKVVPDKVTRFVVPELNDFALKPYVSRKVQKESVPRETPEQFIRLAMEKAATPL